MTTHTGRKRGRPPKFDSQTAMQMLVDEGVRRLRESGYEPGLASVNLDNAIKSTEVPRGAAYRLWGDELIPPQEQFRSAVLLRIFDTGVANEVFAKLDAAIEVGVADIGDDLTSGDEQRRLYAIRAIIRTVARGLEDAVLASDAFRMSRSLARVADGAFNVSDEVRTAIDRAERLLLDHYVDNVERLFSQFGAELREPYTFEQIIHLANALNDGLMVPRRGTDLPVVSRPTGRNGEMQEWTLFALGYEAIVAYFSTDSTLRNAVESPA